MPKDSALVYARTAQSGKLGIRIPRRTCCHSMSEKVVRRRSPIHGNGVFAKVAIKAGSEVVEYRGRLLTHPQADRLYDGTTDTGHTFLFTLNERYVVDGNVGGSVARWINHSCAPNCAAAIVEDEDGDPRADRIVIEAARNIRAGEELTYDYGITLEEPHTAKLKRIWACKCGAPKCTGTLLKPKRKLKKAG